MMVPETGEILSASAAAAADRREIFLLGGVVELEDEDEEEEQDGDFCFLAGDGDDAGLFGGVDGRTSNGDLFRLRSNEGAGVNKGGLRIERGLGLMMGVASELDGPAAAVKAASVEACCCCSWNWLTKDGK